MKKTRHKGENTTIVDCPAEREVQPWQRWRAAKREVITKKKGRGRGNRSGLKEELDRKGGQPQDPKMLLISKAV